MIPIVIYNGIQFDINGQFYIKITRFYQKKICEIFKCQLHHGQFYTGTVTKIEYKVLYE